MAGDIQYQPKRDLLTALDSNFDCLDEHEREFVSSIRKSGWFRTSVLADDEGSGFAYTTGFWLGAGFPEIIAFSLKNDTAHTIFWDVYRDVQAGNPPIIGVRSSKYFAHLDCMLVPCSKKFYRDYLGWSRWFYAGDNFECVQLVWSDRENKFPWESGFDRAFENDQPDLTEHGWITSLAQ